MRFSSEFQAEDDRSVERWISLRVLNGALFIRRMVNLLGGGDGSEVTRPLARLLRAGGSENTRRLDHQLRAGGHGSEFNYAPIGPPVTRR